MPITPTISWWDRGANGGLAGSGHASHLQKPTARSTFQALDNHEVTGLDVVTAATLLNTSLGKVHWNLQ